MSLADDIDAAEWHLAALKLRFATATCTEAGHRWRLVGGRSVGCCPDWCRCSVLVNECATCGECDYGHPAEAKVIDECRYNRCITCVKRLDLAHIDYEGHGPYCSECAVGNLKPVLTAPQPYAPHRR